MKKLHCVVETVEKSKTLTKMDRKQQDENRSLSSRLRELGNLRYKRKEYEKAEEMFSESIVRARESKCEDDEMLALMNRSLSRMKQNQYEAALQDCDFSIDISKRTDLSAEKAYFRRAQCLQKLGRQESALKAFREASGKVSKSSTIKRCQTEIRKLESQLLYQKIDSKEVEDQKTKTKETTTRTKVVQLKFTKNGECPSPHPAINADGCVRYCDACGMGGAINRCGRCKQTIYCSRNCQESHWPFHKTSCGSSSRIEVSRKGKAGLNNVGNTCFLSSVVQCLSHTTPITRILLGNRHVKDINRDNPLGTKDAEVVAEYVDALFSLINTHSQHTHTTQVREPFEETLVLVSIESFSSATSQSDCSYSNRICEHVLSAGQS